MPVCRPAHPGEFGFAASGTCLQSDNAGTLYLAWTSDGGRSWHAADGLGGYRSGSAWVNRSRGGGTVLAVGPTGSDLNRDGGRTWNTFSDSGFHAVECVNSGACYASGSDGRVAVLSWG